TPPEVVAAIAEAEELSRPNSAKRKGGQGFGLSAAEKAVVEQHAMSLAHGWLQDHGYTEIRDVHRNSSCDYLAKKDGKEIHVEVKGTTSTLGSIFITAK